MKLKQTILASSLIAMGLTATAHAEGERYVIVKYGLAQLDNSANSGSFPDGFVTGAGTTIPAGVQLDPGTSLGWETEFDEGESINFAFGTRFGASLRGELEVALLSSDVETHRNVSVADGLSLATEDAGILITGSDNLGASVADLVADGRGEIDSNFYMVNGYYDFDLGGAFSPFIGLGVGLADTDVRFNPSGVDIVDGSDSGIAFQAMVGASFALTDNIDLVGQYRYREAENLEVRTTLFPADLEIENKGDSFDLGIRYNF